MKTQIGILLLLATILCLIPLNLLSKVASGTKVSSENALTVENFETVSNLKSNVQEYLESKKSPLAQHTELLLKQKHWKLLVAISAIESQYCIRQLGNNCWGITNKSGGYSEYSTIAEAIVDANDLIERWQQRGRWLTIKDFDCHYVVPCNPNWVSVVTDIYSKLEQIENDYKNKEL